MRAVVLDIPEDLLEERRKRGLDRWDEVWEGELHMVPPPGFAHGEIESEILAFARPILKRRGWGVLTKAGVREPGSGISNFRVPDLVAISNERLGLVDEGWISGGPDAVIEIRSPGDETYEKLPFYAALGIREVIVIDRDTRRPELFRLAGKALLPVSPAADGTLVSEVLDLGLRALPDGGCRISAREDEPGGIAL